MHLVDKVLTGMELKLGLMVKWMTLGFVTPQVTQLLSSDKQLFISDSGEVTDGTPVFDEYFPNGHHRWVNALVHYLNGPHPPPKPVLTLDPPQMHNGNLPITEIIRQNQQHLFIVILITLLCVAAILHLWYKYNPKQASTRNTLKSPILFFPKQLALTNENQQSIHSTESWERWLAIFQHRRNKDANVCEKLLKLDSIKKYQHRLDAVNKDYEIVCQKLDQTWKASSAVPFDQNAFDDAWDQYMAESVRLQRILAMPNAINFLTQI